MEVNALVRQHRDRLGEEYGRGRAMGLGRRGWCRHRLGLSRRSRGGACLAAAGTTLVYRGATGHWPVYSTLGVTTVGRSDDTRVALGGDRRHPRARVRPDSSGRSTRSTASGAASRTCRVHEEPRATSPTSATAARTGWRAARPGRPSSGTPRSSTRSQNKVIAWERCPAATSSAPARCTFEPVRGGTPHAADGHLQYEPPAGRAGALVAGSFGREPSQTIREDLRRLKQLLEAGEIRQGGGARPALGEARTSMKGVCYYGKEDIRVETVPDPQILNPRDAIVKVTATAICGSDLHIYDGYIPTMEQGDILGHEFMGEVVEVGRGQSPTPGRRPRRRAVHDRLRPLLLLPRRAVVAVRQLQPERLDGREARRLLGLRPLRLLAHVRRLSRAARPSTPACRSPTSVRSRCPTRCRTSRCCSSPTSFPTGYMAAENCDIQPGDTVAVWGCGPVGQFAIKSAYLLGAERVIAIDRFPERLAMAASHGKAEVLNYEDVDVPEALARDDRRPGPGRLHRRRRSRGARHDARTPGTTASRRRCTWRPIGRTRCGRRSPPAARAARCRFPASMAAGSTSSRSAPRSPRA